MHVDRARRYVERMDEVPGYFSTLDAEMFTTLSEQQARLGVNGDLLEIGVWFGRSAILLGYLACDGERVHVNDLFETPPTTEAGLSEFALWGDQKVATRAEFNRNYGRFHAEPPNVLQCPSSELGFSLESDRFRFIHIDGSHTCEAVRGDIELARELLAKGGIVAFDDYANTQHLGVAAAVWPELATLSLAPFAATPSKLFVSLPEYAPRYRATLETAAAGRNWERRMIALPHSEILSVWQKAPSRSLRARIVRKLTRTYRTLRPSTAYTAANIPALWLAEPMMTLF